MIKNIYVTRLLILLVISALSLPVLAQSAKLTGTVMSGNEPVPFANVFLKGTQFGASTDITGKFSIDNIPAGNYTAVVSAIGFERSEKSIELKRNDDKTLHFKMQHNTSDLGEVVITGTLKEVSKLDSPVPVEVYSANFFKSNPTPSIFEAIQNVNGVRPQVNCNVCNTGDIHINGLEGPYTMVLIDGMPIVSGLSTVYGLSGIPQSLIERVEIVKGPASTLYGSEAVGGIINIITKKPVNAPIFSADVFGTTWGEVNTDLAGKFKAGKKAQSLVGVNYFNYSFPIDKNHDGFTDVTLQDRISIFNKWNLDRKENRVFTMAGRYVYEERWGGEMDWTKEYRGGDELYAESVRTKRWELFGTYQLPIKERVMLQFSANSHDQNSAYGDEAYIAQQYVGFGQLTWNKQIRNHDLLTGATFRYTYYDDNTPATTVIDSTGLVHNMASNTYLPGIFVQDEITIDEQNTVLVGIRYDYNSIHGNILTPRINYKWSSKNKKNVLRVGVGNGYRVAHVFTEDHAALTGARQVVFLDELQPETSWNGNVNFVKKIYAQSGTIIGLDASVFYTYFNNKIIPDYETDPNKIIYDNLNGHAVSRGVSLNVDAAFVNGLKFNVGATYMDVFNTDDGVKTRQLFSEHFTGVWNAGYTFANLGLTVDYTGNVYSPMRLPLISRWDPRSEYSPWWSIQNIQVTKKFKTGLEIYGGVKNLLNWTPNKGTPFIIARTNDPFDKEVVFDADGQAIPTPNNPYGLTFDPDYVYAPNQGIRGFLGIRYTFN